MACVSSLQLLPTPAWKHAFGGISIFITITATVENTLVIFLLMWYSNMHNMSNKILASLAVSDLLVGLTIAPMHAMQLLSGHHARHCVIEEVRRYLSTLLIGASAFTIGCISYDRYLHITKLVNYNKFMGNTKVCVMLLVCWFIPGMLPLLRYINNSESIYYISIISLLVLVLGTLVLCYVLIIYGIQKHKERLLKTITTNIGESQWRASRTVIILITCFVLMVMPISVHHVLLISGRGLNVTRRAQLYAIGQTLGMLNSSVNPIIYYYRNPHFKENLHKLLAFNFSRGTMRLKGGANDGESSMQISMHAVDQVRTETSSKLTTI